MEYPDGSILSHYQAATIINDRHGVQLVQHKETGQFFIKKQLTQYNIEVFRALRAHPVPNTPRIYELEENGRTLTVIEEYLQGETLQDLLEKGRTFSEEEAALLVLDLARIVQVLHHRNPPIIHRDIKPSNLILSPDHVLKLLDFNAAKFASDASTHDTVLLGTAGYAAPEQYGFEPSGVQTDLYAIGVVLNVLLTGSLPREKSAEGRLAPIIQRCTEMNPRDRYADIDVFIAELQKALNKAENFGSQSAHTTLQRFTPPGFRSGSPIKMAIAVVGYLYLLFLGILQWKVGLSYLVLVLFTANYLNVQGALPLTKSSRMAVRVVGIVLYDILLFMVLSLFTVL
ncbi:MAG: serine/threonine protein kinase [Clostridiales bacterium]|nr:serine/threonine protein kinase [Clostridiales bacterium]